MCPQSQQCVLKRYKDIFFENTLLEDSYTERLVVKKKDNFQQKNYVTHFCTKTLNYY